MKHKMRKTAAMALAVVLGLAPLASASEALGHEIHGTSVDLSVGTSLTKQIFWSDTYSDLRTERYFTYSPNRNVQPVVAYGDKVTSRATLTAMAQTLEQQGKRLVGGMNGDLYVMATGAPLGVVITDGVVRSAPGNIDFGYYGVGFRGDGTAFIGKPELSITATFRGNTFSVGGGVNKVRTELGGYTLYTEDFNATTQNTSAGVDVILVPVVDNVGQTVNVDLDVSEKGQDQPKSTAESGDGGDVVSSDGLTEPPAPTESAEPISEVKGSLLQSAELTVGGRVTYRVEQVLEAAGATAIPAGKAVLSINGKGDPYLIAELRALQAGDTIDVDITTPEQPWTEADQAMGGLHKLVTAGQAEKNLPAERTAYSAVGVKADGTAVFYTIDGKQPGYSVGATLTQVAMRMVELGCVDAVSLDGGGSTTIGATYPTDSALGVLNKPSDGSQRANSVAIFLATETKATGELGSLYVTPSDNLLLSGTKVTLTATPLDTVYYPMTSSENVVWSIQNGDGMVSADGVFTAGGENGVTQVTASAGKANGNAAMTVVKKPDSISLTNETNGAAVTALNLEPGEVLDLKANSVYKKLALTSDDTCYTWTLDGAVGTVDQNGVITAGEKSASGTLTVTAGGTSMSISVAVAGHVKTLDGFESGIDSVTSTEGAAASWESNLDYVRYGAHSLRVDYNAGGTGAASLPTTLTIAAGERYLNLWVYGDGSGNSLTATIADKDGATSEVVLTSLDGSGWKFVTARLPDNAESLRSLNLIYGGAEGKGAGTFRVDQITTSNETIQDTTAPVVTLSLTGTALQAVAADNIDKQFDKSQVALTYDGKSIDFTWDAAASTMKATLPAGDGRMHRVAVNVTDASGNIGRGAANVAASAEREAVFTDTAEHWAGTFAVYLYDHGITTGVPNEADGTLQFQPDRTITRGEFFAMTARWLGVDLSQYDAVELPFADAAEIPDWALSGVKAMYSLGYLKGTMDGGVLKANATATISRAEAMTLLGRIQERGYTAVELTFTDAASVPDWALEYVKTLVGQGVVGGYENRIMPGESLRRGEVAKMLFTMT